MQEKTMAEPSTLSGDTAAPATKKREHEYVVVARRYRPQAFAELVGQQHVAQALSGAITSNRVGHAYLFTGARGVGKTSAARILGKSLNCIHGPTPTPCNECDICQSISAGEDVDVLEIDGASNRGIDEIRELRQKVNVRPSRSRFKIYIIDEVHMLTREAFNALLKTLEEPPEHVKFIFCTTEAERIPITILSRCQRFDFAGIQTGSITERLRQIVESEGVTAEPEALEILARRAAGSMRDSQSLLEQLLALGGAQITVADVHRMLGTAGDRRLAALVDNLVQRDIATALGNLDAALAEGVDVGQLLDQLLGYCRDLMVAAVGCSDDALLHIRKADAGQAKAAAQQLGLETILAIMQILEQTLHRMRYSTHGRILAELALVRACKLEDLDELASLIAEVRQGGDDPAPPVRPKPSLPAPSMPAPNHSAPAMAKKKAELEPGPAAVASSVQPATDAIAPASPPPLTRSDADESPSAAATSPTCPAAASYRLSEETVPRLWQQVLESLSDMTSANAAMCERVAISAPNRLVLSFRAKYTSCKLFCERPEQVAKLEKAIQTLTGSTIRIEFATLEDDPQQTNSASGGGVRPQSTRERIQERAEHPMVRRAMELFEARHVRLS
jgi:DNA polymerase-3 subunit gamma/tau